MRKQLARILGRYRRGKIRYIPMKRIKPSPLQPRRNFDEQQLVGLAQSISINGLLQPIIVKPDGRNYQIVAGERRFRAFCLLGKSHIPAYVWAIDDKKAAVLSLAENLQRCDINYLEEAYAYYIVHNVIGMSTEELGKKVGRSKIVIEEKLRLLKLPNYIQSIISRYNVSEKHARVLLKLNSGLMQEELLKQIYEKELNIRETEDLAKRLSSNNIPKINVDLNSKQNVSMIIRDARIFVNTIKETVKRAKQTGIDIIMAESDTEEHYEVVIRVKIQNQSIKALAKTL